MSIDTTTLEQMHSADEEWIQRAHRTILRLAKKHQTVHVNDVWDVAETEDWEEPFNKKALGAAFRRAAADGAITISDTAIRVSHNGGHYWRPIWISQIYKKKAA